MTCSSFGILNPYQTVGQLSSLVELRPAELCRGQAFDSFQTGIGQVGSVELGQTQICASQNYGLTTGSGIVEALVRAKQCGVDVRLIADKTTPCRRASGIGALADVGVPIGIDDQPRIAHAKTMVIAARSP